MEKHLMACAGSWQHEQNIGVIHGQTEYSNAFNYPSSDDIR